MAKSISTQLTASNIDAVITMLAAMPGQLAYLQSALSPEEWMTPLAPGERTPTEVLAHLINTEARSSVAIYLALLLDQPLFPVVHPERDWGHLLQYNQFTFDELLAYFQLRRQVLLGVLTQLNEAQWARTIREEHKQRQESVYWRARSMATHEQDHLLDFQAKLPDIW